MILKPEGAYDLQSRGREARTMSRGMGEDV